MQTDMRRYMDLMEDADSDNLIKQEMAYIKKNTPLRLAEELEWTQHEGHGSIMGFEAPPGEGLPFQFYEDTGIDISYTGNENSLHHKGLVAEVVFEGSGMKSRFPYDTFSKMVRVLTSLGYQQVSNEFLLLSVDGMDARPFDFPKTPPATSEEPPVTSQDISSMADEITQDLYSLVKSIVKGRGFDDADGNTRNQVMAEIDKQISNGEIGIRS